ncbi:hypothetical protein H5410_030448, partial [Solanum commersonii]
MDLSSSVNKVRSLLSFISFSFPMMCPVDIPHAPFIERFQIFMPEGFNYDITTGRPKLAKWIE